MKRVIITADLLVEMFGKYEHTIMLACLYPFMLAEDKALASFDETILGLKKEEESKGKHLLIEAFQEMKSAFQKMSIFERERIRKDLPKKIGLFLIKKKIIRKKKVKP